MWTPESWRRSQPRFPTAEIVLADTIGVATPKQVRGLVERTRAPGVHLHNTRNTGYANAVAALESGATLFDASCGGLGGCPYAPRATGNIATEDLVYLFDGEGVETGIDLDALVADVAVAGRSSRSPARGPGLPRGSVGRRLTRRPEGLECQVDLVVVGLPVRDRDTN